MASHNRCTNRSQNLKTHEKERLKAEQMAASGSQKYDYLKDDDGDDVSTGPAVSMPLSILQWRPTFPAGPSRKEVSETLPLNIKSAATDGLSWAQVASLKSLNGEVSETSRTASHTVNLNRGNRTVLPAGYQHGRSNRARGLGLTSQREIPVEPYGGWTPIPKFLKPNSVCDDISEAGDVDFSDFFGKSETPPPPDVDNLNEAPRSFKIFKLGFDSHSQPSNLVVEAPAAPSQKPVAPYGGWTPIPKFLNPTPVRDDQPEADDVDFSEFFGESESESQTLTAPGPSTSQKIVSRADEVSDASERNNLNHDSVVMPKSESAGPDDELLNDQITAALVSGPVREDEYLSDHLMDMIIDIPPFVLKSESETEILKSQPESLHAVDVGSQGGWNVVGKRGKGKKGNGKRGEGKGM